MDNLQCTICDKKYLLDDIRWKCDCGATLDIEYEFSFDIQKISKRKHNIWRYRESIPVNNDENIISFNESFTPLVKTKYDNRIIYIKLEQLFPTGSFKDRGTSVLISKVKELGIKKVIEDSSGNAGSSIAAYCAKAGIECHIYVPEYASIGKLIQIQSYGAILHKISKTREDAAHAALSAAENIYYASHSWNPFFFQGMKTFSFELWEQLDFKAPDTIVIPLGNGALLIGIYLGFKDLLKNKLLDKLPHIIAVQASNCAPIYKMQSEKLSELPDNEWKTTIAEGTAVTKPIRAKQIIDIMSKINGEIITVTEEEIKKALTEVCLMGFYLEPTSAISFAGFKKTKTSKNEIIVIPITGHGLKTTDKIGTLLKK
jgi:threonine synthase